MVTELKDGVYWVGATDWALRTFHGHELSTHRGSTYNAYLIVDERVALVDTVLARFSDELMANVRKFVDPAKIDFVVANHALVMLRAAMEGGEEGQLPSHYVFDEGHHVFEAADNAFAAQLSGQETHDLRRWLLGAEGGRRAGGRGDRRGQDPPGGRPGRAGRRRAHP